MLARTLRQKNTLFFQARSFGGYVQPPLSQGKGAKDTVIPSDDDQATGREREELKALAKGVEYFNRKPIQMQKGQGTFKNPVLIPSSEPDRIVGMVPKGQGKVFFFFFFLFRCFF